MITKEKIEAEDKINCLCPTCKKTGFVLYKSDHGKKLLTCNLCDATYSVLAISYFNAGWNAAQVVALVIKKAFIGGKDEKNRN